jgi:long-subunit fatty acid transport protein
MNYLKSLILSLAIIVCSLTSFAQKHSIGVKGGINIAGYEFDTNRQVPYNTTTRSIFGIDYSYYLGERWAIGAGLLYNQRGRELDVTFTDDEGTVLKNDIIAHKMDFVSIPIFLSYKTKGKMYAHASVAFLPSILAKSSTEFPDELPVVGQPDDTSNYKPIDLGGMAEIGIGYKASDRLRIQLAGGYQRSYTIRKSDDLNPQTNMIHSGYMITLGLKYALGQ